MSKTSDAEAWACPATDYRSIGIVLRAGRIDRHSAAEFNTGFGVEPDGHSIKNLVLCLSTVIPKGWIDFDQLPDQVCPLCIDGKMPSE